MPKEKIARFRIENRQFQHPETKEFPDGNYLVEEAISEDGLGMTTNELLAEHIDAEGGPLIHPHEQTWQEEIDMVCRKLHKGIRADHVHTSQS